MAETVLFVDDDPRIRTALSDELAKHGIAVHAAAAGDGAFAALEAHPDIGLALVDFSLPGEAGIGLCRRIAARYPGIAVALYAADDALADLRIGHDIPVLLKTMRFEQFAAAVRDLLEGGPDASGRADGAELPWRRDLNRETVAAAGRAFRSQFDRTLHEPLPPSLSLAVYRLRGPQG